MRAVLTPILKTGEHSPARPGGTEQPRIWRLLALYRLVAAAAVASVVGYVASMRFGAGVALVVGYTAFTLLYFTRRVGQAPRKLSLLVALLADLLLIGFLLAHGGERLLAIAVAPVLLVHGWFLRSYQNLLHAGLATGLMLASDFAQGQNPFTSSNAYFGLLYFASAGFGMMLGRASGASENLAHSRAEDVKKLEFVNQLVIEDMQDGVLLVDHEGQLQMSNPRAQHWLLGRAQKPGESINLASVSQPLAMRWTAWREGHTQTDGARIRSHDRQRQLATRFVATDRRSRGDVLIFLEDVERAQTQAQNLKLASLGSLTANIAHEIRNPLSAIKQSAQLLSEDLSEVTAAKPLLNMIEKNTQRIERIVTNVLSLSRRDKAEPQSILLKQHLPELIVEFCAMRKVPQSAVALKIEGDPITRCDKGHLEEIVWNLLGNGWRHCLQKDTSLTVSARLRGSHRHIAIVVSDDGNGVPNELRDRIFEPFYSGAGSSGLGLYICRELAEANQGRLELTSDFPGAHFRLTLPGQENYA